MLKKILITGGGGYIGSACATAFLEAGYKVVVFDDFSTGQADKLPAEVEVVRGDITKRTELDKVCQNHKFEAVIHCAAKKAVGESEVNPSLYFYTNVFGSMNVLSVMEENKIPQILFSSTAAVYEPNPAGEPIKEDGVLKPVNVYGRTKLMVEEMIVDYARLNKISNYTIFRYFNVAGDVGINFRENNAQNVFPLLAKALTAGTEFSIFGTDYPTKDGTGVRDYIHLADLVVAHMKALEGKTSGIFNLGTGKGYSVRDLTDAFSRLSGKELNVKETSRRPGDPAILTADATKAKNELGWEPKKTLEDMVKSTLATYGV